MRVFTVPNALSAMRIASVPVIAAFLFKDELRYQLIGLGILLFAAVTDLFDGWLARHLHQESRLGTILDPMGDKLLVSVLIVILVLKKGFPVWLALFMIGKDLALFFITMVVLHSSRIVIPSNIVGKYAFGFAAGLVFCGFAEFPTGIWWGSWLAVLFGVFAVLSYVREATIHRESGLEGVLAMRARALSPRPAVTIVRRILFTAFMLLLIRDYAFFLAGYRASVELPETHSSLDREVGLSLLETYAPILAFDSEETMLPVAAEEYMERSKLRRSGMYFFGFRQSDVDSGPIRTAYLDTLLSDASFYLEPQETGRKPWNGRPVIYGRAAQAKGDAASGVVLQYWMLFPWKSGPMPGQELRGQWEGIQVRLNAVGDPVSACYSRHPRAETREWSRVKRVEGRPLVFISRGSHGAYFSSGIHKRFLDASGLIRIGTNETNGTKRLRYGPGYSLEWIDGTESWVRFDGRWGERPYKGSPGPRGIHPRNPELSFWYRPMEFEKRFATR